MAKYKVVSAFSLGGGKDVYAGDVIELDPIIARVKMQQGWVVPVLDLPDPGAGPAAVEAEAQHADPDSEVKGRRTRAH